MEAEQRRTMLKEFYAIWSTGDLSGVDELFAEDFVDHTSGFLNPHLFGSELPIPVVGREPFKEFVRLERRGCPDLVETPLSLVVEGEDAIGMYRTTGTHGGEFFGIPATGRHIEFVGIDWLRIVDGKFTEWWYSNMTFHAWSAMGLRAKAHPVAG